MSISEIQNNSEEIKPDIDKCPICNENYGFLSNRKKYCFVCEREVCNKCLISEKKFSLDNAISGYPCRDCENKTKSRVALPGVDLSKAVYHLIDNEIPELITKLNIIVDSGLNKITAVLDTQKKDFLEIPEFYLKLFKKYIRSHPIISCIIVTSIFLAPVFITIEVLITIKIFYWLYK